MDAHSLLRSARLARGIPLDQVITETKMSPRVVHALDEGRFSDLPGGIYARSYVRMFADVVGLGHDALDEIAPLLPDAADPLPVIKHIVVEQKTREARVRTRALRTGLAAVIDGIVLVGLEAGALECVARVTRTTSAALADGSAIPLALLFAAFAAIYFLLLAGINGATIGTRLCGVKLVAPARKLDLRSIGRRAARACLIEASVVATIGRGRAPRRPQSDRRFAIEGRLSES